MKRSSRQPPDAAGGRAVRARAGGHMRQVLVAALMALLAVGLSMGCGSSSAGDDVASPGGMVDDGSWYARHRWPHDGNPIETDTFVVYSDAAGIDARMKAAEVAEEVWAEAIAKLGLDPDTMFRYPRDQDKIDLYIYRGYDPQDWGGQAYYAGMLIWSPDHPGRQNNLGDYSDALMHEVIHVIQMLIMGTDEFDLDLWYFEGLAEAMAGGTAAGAIRGNDQLEDLTAEHGRLSPIAVKDYSYGYSADAGESFYYPMFQLAVEYLLDEEGQGRSHTDARDVMLDVAAGASFATAFEDRMAMDVYEFEAEFFNLMDGYLPRYRNPLFTQVGFALVSVVVIALVVGAVVVGSRRRQLVAAAGDAERPPPGRAARIGHRAGMTVAGLVVVLFFLSGLSVLGTTDALYNRGNDAERIRAYWILAGYLAASVGLLLWATHRWAHRARSAFLVAPLVLVATVATAFGFIASF